MSKSDNAKDEIMTEQPLEENEKQHSASDKEDTGKKKTDGRQVKAAINVIRKKVKAPSAQADEGAQPKLTEKISAVFVKGLDQVRKAGQRLFSAEKREDNFTLLRIFLPRWPNAPPPVDRPVPGTGTLPDAGGAGGGGHAPRIPPFKADHRKIYAD